jgi:DNA-binding beta-propeller fold protein YncE
MGHRKLHTPFCLVLSLLALLILAPAAGADTVIGSPGSGAGQYTNPEGVAVDTETGRVYVADTADNRVDVFDNAGAFLFAFGWKVNAAAPEEKLQTCTTASGCQKGSSGPGVGQLSNPRYIAVDSTSHAVYLADSGNNRVEKFDSEGHFLLMVGKGVNGGSSGKPNLCTSAGFPTDVCKAGGEGGGAGEFDTIKGIGIGPNGAVYVADTRQIGSCQTSAGEGQTFSKRVQAFSPLGEVIKQILPNENPCGSLPAFAVDSAGGFYIANGVAGIGGVYKYDESGAAVTGWGENGVVDPGSANVGGLALDSAGDLFVTDNSGFGSFDSFLEYDPSGAQNRLFFAAVDVGTFAAIAFDPLSGGLFGAEQFHGGADEKPKVVQVALPPPGPGLVPGTVKACPARNVRATLCATFNPQGKPSTAHFEYITKAAYEAAGNSFGPGTKTTPDSAPTPADFESHTASATNVCVVPGEATCLTPETAYYVRAIAKNADGEVKSEAVEFTTLPPLQIVATWTADVGTDTARLDAEVNPLGIAATGRFEYVDDATFQADAPNGFQHAQSTPVLNFGAGEAPVMRASQIYPLKAGITYHYRLVAEDAFFAPVFSQARTFATFPPRVEAEINCANQAFRTGPSASLPDCRAYEMVTPLDKSNADIITRTSVSNYPTNLDQSSLAGSAFTYSSARAFADPESAPYTNQYLAARHERGQADEGWSSESIDPLRGPPFFFELENEYKAFSPDLSSGWMLQEGEPPLDPCAPAGFAGLYRRDSAAGTFQALSCATPSGSTKSREFIPELEGFSDDGSHAVFRIDDELASSPPASTATTSEEGRTKIYQVYESTGSGPLRLVSVLPSGQASGVDSSAGSAGENLIFNHNRFQHVEHAVSADGSRVFWSTRAGQIYLRLNADQAQSKVEAGKCSQPAKACTIAVSAAVTSQAARFQTANPQGTKALFSVQAGPLTGNLYEFDAEADPPASQLIAKKVQRTDGITSILGASEDLSRVYFVSEEATAPQQAEGALEGGLNVYLYEAGTTRFVATLAPSDLTNAYGNPMATTPILQTARVSADGAGVVFMSNSKALGESSAGYDNTGVLNGKPVSEVYLYDATADAGKGKLRCISCDPSGARPSGRELQDFDGKNDPGQNGWAAAAIPRPTTQLYRQRYISDDGKRVFFNSFDPLALADTNGKADVYQWEAAGTGGCGEESRAYVPGSEGCLSLISSGQSPFDSEFLDANQDGADVFFTTAEGLLPQDYGLIDVYDARIDGGFPPPPNPTPACEGEACQGPPAPPNDPTPASSAFEGAGNVKEGATRARCAKGKTRSKGRCVAKKHKRAKKSNQGKANRNRGAGR